MISKQNLKIKIMENRFVKETRKVVTKKIMEVEIDVPQYDWDSIPSGTYVEAIIDGTSIQGVYVKEEDGHYIAQNEKDGTECEQKYGYKYSWVFYPEDVDKGESSVTNLTFPEPPADFVLTPDEPREKPLVVKVGDYEAEVFSNYIVVGCQTITRDVIDLVIKTMEEIKTKESEESKG